MSDIHSVAADDCALVLFGAGEDDIAKSIDFSLTEHLASTIVVFTLLECLPDEPRDLIETREYHREVLN